MGAAVPHGPQDRADGRGGRQGHRRRQRVKFGLGWRRRGAPTRVQVEICLGADTTVDADIVEAGTPVINIWSRHSDVEIQPHGNGTADLAAAEELVWAASWYARQVRTLVQRSQRQSAGDADSASVTGQPGGVGGRWCPVWCDNARCTALRPGGEHMSRQATVEGRLDASVVVWLVQAPEQRPVLVLATGRDAVAPADGGRRVSFSVDAAERLARAWGWLLDAATIGAPVLDQVGVPAAAPVAGGLDEPLRYPCGCPMLAGTPWPGQAGQDPPKQPDQRRSR